MSEKSRVNPRFISNVLQAITNLKDVTGSTPRQIIEQVQTTINSSNVKPKPRNIGMQVKKALRHAVEMGILKLRAGKYKFALGQDNTSAPSKNSRTRQKPQLQQTLKRGYKKRNRSKQKRLRRKRKPQSYKKQSSYESSTPSTRCSDCYSSSSGHSYIDSEDNLVHRRSSRRKRSQKKNVRKTKPTKKRGRKGRRTVKRQSTPVPSLASRAELNDDTGSFKNFTSNIFQENEYVPQSLLDFPQDDHADPMEMQPKCENLNFIYNLKQEDFDDDTNDD